MSSTGPGPRRAPRANCGVHYVPEAFSADKAGVVGRQSAGAGFLDALIRYGEVEPLYCIADDGAAFEDFCARVASVAPGAAAEWVRPFDADAMERAGCMFTPGPLISEGAWMRRFVGERRYALCGVTHSVATERVIRGIRDFLVAPTQPWDALVCTSEAARGAILNIFEGWSEYLRSRGFAVEPVPVQFPVIPLGVHLDRFERTEAAAERGRALRGALGIPPEDVVVLHFGRFDFRSKMHPTPVFAALQLAQMKHRSSTIHLVMVGQFADQVTADQFSAAQFRHARGVAVHWIDGLDAEAASASWWAADVFLSLADNVQESFGLTPVEAMAASLPCVVADWNGYKASVVDGVTGFRIPTVMAPPGAGIELADAHARRDFDHFTLIALTAQCTGVDVDACADALARLARDPGLRRQMGHEGRRRAERQFDWRGVIGQYQDLWAELGERRRTRPGVGERRPDRQTVHPDFPDLFALFAGHPTRTLSDRTTVLLADLDAQHALSEILRLPMDAYGASAMLSADRIRPWLDRLSTGSLRVGDLIGDIGAGERQRALRTVAWLHKFGLIALGDEDARDGVP